MIQSRGRYGAVERQIKTFERHPKTVYRSFHGEPIMTKKKSTNPFEESWEEPSDSEMFDIYVYMKIAPEQLINLELRGRYAEFLKKRAEQGSD